MAHRDALGIAVELQHHKFSRVVRAEGFALLRDKVFRVARAFHAVRQGNGGVASFDLNHRGLVLASNAEHALEHFPRVLLDLLVSKAHAAVFFVQFQDHHLDFVAHVAEFGRVLDFLRPAEVGNVDEAVDALFQFHEQTEVREVPHGSLLLGLHGVARLDVRPRILGELLQAERHLPLFAINAEHHAFNLVVHVQEILRTAQVLAP